VIRARVPCLAFLLSLGLLAGCGGGGGGSTPPPTDGVTPPTNSGPQVSGLLPSPPVLGAVLADNALTLRPVREGSTWAYSGNKLAYKSATPVSYSTITKQTVSDNLIVEASTNSSNDGASTQNLSLAQGVVSSIERLDFAGKGAAQDIKFIELRSPVRLGDQYTILDQRFTDTNIDADKDNKTDILDVVIYSRVMGRELVQLPGLPQLTAIRVDTTAQSRVIYSSNGQSSALTQSTVQSWYVAGIGLVRQVSSVPTASGTDTETTEESLVYWDGVTTGFGRIPPQPATIPIGNADYPGLTVPSNIVGYTAMADSALVVSRLPGAGSYSTGGLVSRLDLRGKVLSAYSYPGMLVGEGKYIGHANGLLHLRVPILDGLGRLAKVEVTRFNAEGRLQGSLAGVTIDLTGGRSNSWLYVDPVAAIEGSTLWLLWHRLWPGSNGFDGVLALRPYTLEGVPLAGEIVLETRWCCDELAISAKDGKALVSWQRTIPGVGYDLMYASANVAAGSVSPVALLKGLQRTSGAMAPLLLGQRAALLWPAPLGEGQATYYPNAVGGVILDEALNPILGSGGTINGQVLTGQVTAGLLPIAMGSRIVLSVPGKLTWWDTDTSPLISTTSKSVTIGEAYGREAIQLVFHDRVLLLLSAGSGWGASVVWLNAGP
jgi:hypothetical protein